MRNRHGVIYSHCQCGVFLCLAPLERAGEPSLQYSKCIIGQIKLLVRAEMDTRSKLLQSQKAKKIEYTNKSISRIDNLIKDKSNAGRSSEEQEQEPQQQQKKQ